MNLKLTKANQTTLHHADKILLKSLESPGKTSVSAAVLAAVPKRDAHYRDPISDRKRLFQKSVRLTI
ncbi:hypothetical protein GCHA_1747 [Paraglaciecola chathamensis S18K6]|uniref:Uncharacterized protein n=1 Tax=Paraglaciecola chathamensis S18K6 TaxID=1127672 RepID=A0AAV3UWN3_9ALTE|nr:hypothetical protein GCHA_1747 [Paraglaciecola chathamensis S18K6]